jgi:serine/threonine protein kinase
LQDQNGDLWIGTYGGLSLLKDGHFTNYTTANGLAGQVVFSIYEDQPGSLLIGTDSGLHHFSNGKFTVLTTKDGLFDDIAFNILADEQGNYWLSCNQGIYRFNKKDLADYERKAIASIPCVSYGRLDGMKSKQCNGSSQPASWQASTGQLWFATEKGVSMIDPKNIKLNLLPPPVRLDRIIVDNQIINAEDGLIFAPGKERFELHYAGLSLIAPAKVKFKYMMVGFDKDWIEADTRRVAYYTNLPPGDYQFKVSACNNDGIWNEAGAAFHFQLKPPFTRTWWAYLCYILATAGIGYSIMRLRLQTLEKRNLLLETKVAERTAEIARSKEEIDKKNRELAEKIDQLRISQDETEKKNRELAIKNEALIKSKEDLVESHKQAELIFSALSDVLPGTVLADKYRLDEKIGSGGFGAIFRATHLDMQRQVAVKVFRPTAGNASKEALDRFRLEAISACRINHPNAIAVLDSGVSTGGIAYLVMELLNGRTLAEELDEKRQLSPQRCAEIIIPICDVLGEAHSLGIIHRDIKPENIFLHKTRDGEIVKVFDFGIAKILSGEAEESMSNLTGMGNLIGTPTYMSPERLSNRPYDGKSDVYSVGIMFYEMLAGRAPFEDWDGNIWSVINMHLHEEPPPLIYFVKDLPATVEKVVLSAMVKDPEKRPSARDLAQSITTALMIKASELVSGTFKVTLSGSDANLSADLTDSMEAKRITKERANTPTISVEGPEKID